MSRLPVPKRLRRRLWFGIWGGAVFMTTACVDAARRPDYDAWHQSVSALSLGPDGWFQTVNFILFGVVILSTVPAWRRLLIGAVGATALPALTALTGVSLIATGILPQDPAPGYDPLRLGLTAPTLRGLLHLLFAAIGAGCAVASLAVMARRFARDSLWRGWNAYTLLMSVAMTMCFGVYAVWSTASSGYAGTFERVGLMLLPVWGFTFVRRLAAGTPFMFDLDPAAPQSSPSPAATSVERGQQDVNSS